MLKLNNIGSLFDLMDIVLSHLSLFHVATGGRVIAIIPIYH
jgi:hypothetical protein